MRISEKKNIYLCFINYAEVFHCVDYDKLWKALRKMGIPDQLTCLLRMYVGQEATVRTLYGQLIGSRLRKEYDMVVCCHPACLTDTLSTSREMPGWLSYKLESR